MALPSTGLLTGMMIRNALQETVNNMAALSRSVNINMFSPNKPYTRTVGTMKGLYRDSYSGLLKYAKPTAEEVKYGSDFHGYDHDAEPSTVIEIISIYENGVDIYDPLGTTLYYSLEYEALVSVRRGTGAIDPSLVDSLTKWSKPAGDGAGGLLIESFRFPEAEGYSKGVVDVTITETYYQFKFKVNNPDAPGVDVVRPFRIEYAQRVLGVWQGTGMKTEGDDPSFSNDRFPCWYNAIQLSPFLLSMGVQQETTRLTVDTFRFVIDFYNDFTDRSFNIGCEMYIKIDGVNNNDWIYAYKVGNWQVSCDEFGTSEGYEVLDPSGHIQAFMEFIWPGGVNMPAAVQHPSEMYVCMINYDTGATYGSYQYNRATDGFDYNI